MLQSQTTVMSTPTSAETSTEKPTSNGTMNGVLSKTPFVIGVAGGTASGKVSL